MKILLTSRRPNVATSQRRDIIRPVRGSSLVRHAEALFFWILIKYDLWRSGSHIER